MAAPFKTKTILTTAGLILLAILAGLALWRPTSSEPPEPDDGYGGARPLPAPGPLSRAFEGLGYNHLVTEEFSSHLPLVILTPAAKGDGYEILQVLDGPGSVNRPGDRPAAELKVLITGGEPSYPRHKKTQAIRAVIAGRHSLLGLPENDRWLLGGSEGDPAMLRNYLGYTLGRAVLDGRAPQTRWCELLLRTESGLIYQGLHLWSELPAAVEGQEVKAARYLPGPGGGQPHKVGARLCSYSAESLEHHCSPGGALPLRGSAAPGGGGSADDRKYIEAALNRVQTLLTSGDPETYLGYQEALEVDSVVNSGLLYELMMNYQADGPTLNLLLTPEGRLGLEPDWRFDEALDNTVEPLPKSAQSAARTMLWLPELFKSADFVEEYRNRFYRLFRGPLDPARIDGLIDDTVLFLGPALLRDWRRWGEAYQSSGLKPRTGQDGQNLIRATRSPEQEIVKIKRLLRDQNQKIRLELQELRWRPGLIDSSNRTGRNAALAALFIAAFFAVVALARNI